MARKPALTDPKTGEPIDTEVLKRSIDTDELFGVRQVQPRFPSWGMSPERLAIALRDSIGHDPSLYYELCTDIVEKDLHYQGVLSQRRLASAQLPIAVDPASDAREHVAHADLVRGVFDTPEFAMAVFGIYDALDKGISGTEIVWETTEGQWLPTAFNFVLPTWFRFDRQDLKTPLLLDDLGQPQPLAPYKWILHRPMLRSGLPVRDGLSRSAAWAWMFKNFSTKAWMIFLEKYGAPVRIIRYPASATPTEKAIALEAIRNLGIDGGALVPEGMNIEIVKGDGAGSGGDAFLGNATFWDEQMSKLVVGQTGTTDSSKGGYAVGRVHDGVRASIVNYDGLVLGYTLARDVVRPLVDLNFGPQKAYPKVKIGLGDEKNLELVLKTIGEMVDRGLEVEASQIYPLLGLTEPAKGRDVVLLRAMARAPEPGEQPGGTSPPRPDDRAGPTRRGGGAPKREERAAALDEPAPPDSIDALSDELAADPAMLADIRRQIEAAIDESSSYAELRVRLDGLAHGPVGQRFVEQLALSLFNARLAAEMGAPVRPTEDL